MIDHFPPNVPFAPLASLAPNANLCPGAVAMVTFSPLLVLHGPVALYFIVVFGFHMFHSWRFKARICEDL